MSLRAVTITSADSELHEDFLRFVPRVFPSIDFRAWHACGGWNERYRAIALYEGGVIVANASLLEMDIVLKGRPVCGWQLGAVGTLPTHRGRGLQRAIMERVLAHAAPDDLVFLFANDSVLDFYPRFGFERVREQLFRVPLAVEPAGEPLRVLDVTSAEDRALLARVAHSAEPRCFGARDYASTLLWYACNFYPHAVRYAPELDAVVAVDRQGDRLHVLDVQAERTFDLRALLPRLIDAPVVSIELGFTADRYLPDALAATEYGESALFIRGPHQRPEGPLKYPVLAQT